VWRQDRARLGLGRARGCRFDRNRDTWPSWQTRAYRRWKNRCAHRGLSPLGLSCTKSPCRRQNRLPSYRSQVGALTWARAIPRSRWQPKEPMSRPGRCAGRRCVGGRIGRYSPLTGPRRRRCGLAAPTLEICASVVAVAQASQTRTAYRP